MNQLRLIASIFLIYLHLVGFGQQNQYLYYDLSEAVANEVIKGVTKDKNGFIWFATDQGVLKYDGRSTVLYKRDLQSLYTKNFLNTADGRLLVINDQGIKEIESNEDTVAFVPFNIGKHTIDQNLGFPKSIYQDGKGNIWIGEVSSVLRINESGIKRFELGVPYQSISYHRTFTFREDAFGTLWIAPFKGSLLRFDSQLDELVPVDTVLPLTDITGFTIVQGDYLIFGGKEGIFELKVDSDKQVLSSRFSDAVGNISAIQGTDDQVFIGTWDQGLLVMDFDDRSISKVEEVGFNDVVDFFYDKSVPEIWVVGSENVGLLSFSVIHAVKGMEGFRIESISLDEDELYYSIGQEVKSMNWSTGVTRSILESKNNYFDRIQIDGDNLWIGDSFGAVIKLDIANGTLDKIVDSTGVAIKFVMIDNAGNKWFAGDWDRLTKVSGDNDQATYYPVKSSNVIRQAQDGTIYCGSYGPKNILHKYKASSDQFVTIDLNYDFELDSDVSAEDIAIDDEGNIWIASNVGVLKYESSTSNISRITIPNLDPSKLLKAIAIHNGVTWIAGDFGLIAYDGENALLYNTKNGLPSKILNWRSLTSADAGILISTAKGLAIAQSHLLKFEKTPKPVILSVKSKGDNLTKDKDGVNSLPYHGSLQAEFITLTYPSKQVIYQSRLLGMDDNWSEATSNTQVSFLGFSPGDYTLEVRSREIGALWSELVSYNFRVKKPWFRTVWAYIMFAAGTLLVFVIAIRAYNYNLILQKRRFKKIIDDRTLLIQEQKNEIIAQKNRIIEQKEELLAKNNAMHKSQQALSEADVNFLHLKEKQLQDQIDYRNKQITTHALHIIQKNETLKELRSKLESIIKSQNKSPQQEIKKTLKLIDDSYRLDKDWDDFKLYFEQVYTGFYTKLKVNCPSLTVQELRHCALIRLNLSITECASILGISPDSVKVSRSRIRKKLDMEVGQGLTDFILSI
ncbi:MAG: triple tyrosine motif-containing protein [Marinoscillum sp.]